MLYYFTSIYPSERIDSVRYLLEDKEKQMRRIVQMLDEQKSIKERIARQVPEIAYKSTQKNNPRSRSERASWVSSVKGGSKAHRDYHDAPFS